MSGISSPSRLVEEYYKGEMSEPPKELSPIYVSPKQSDETLEGLAITYSVLPEKYRKGLQLFEIPQTSDDCLAYTGLQYSNTWIEKNWTSNGWTQIRADDFSSRKNFAKVIEYRSHVALQWGSGTFLHKCGTTRTGATPVYNILDPHHPLIEEVYGRVQSVWIQKIDQEAPSPFYRFPSTYLYGPCNRCDSYSPVAEILKHSVRDYKKIHENLVNQRDDLRKKEQEKKENFSFKIEKKS